MLRTTPHGRLRRRRILTYAVLAVSTVLMVNALVGEHGYLATLRAKRETDALTEEIEKIKTQNQQLKDLTDRIKHDPATLEEAARRDLGLIKPGETVIILHDEKDSKPAVPSAK